MRKKRKKSVKKSSKKEFSLSQSQLKTLLDLPNEVLYNIFSFLDSKNLAVLNQTCKSLYNFNQIFLPHHKIYPIFMTIRKNTPLLQRLLTHEMRKAKKDRITALTVSLNGRTVIVGRMDGNLEIWNAEDFLAFYKVPYAHRKRTHEGKLLGNEVTSIEFIDESHFAILRTVASEVFFFEIKENNLHLYDKISMGEEESEIAAPNGYQTLTRLFKGRLAVLCSRFYLGLFIYKLDRHSEEIKLEDKLEHVIACAPFGLDHLLLAKMSIAQERVIEQYLYRWNQKTKKEEHLFLDLLNTKTTFGERLIVSDNYVLYNDDFSGYTLYIWERKTKSFLGYCKGIYRVIQQVVLFDERYLVVCYKREKWGNCRDNLYIWDLEKCRKELAKNPRDFLNTDLQPIESFFVDTSMPFVVLDQRAGIIAFLRNESFIYSKEGVQFKNKNSPVRTQPMRTRGNWNGFFLWNVKQGKQVTEATAPWQKDDRGKNERQANQNAKRCDCGLF